MLKGFKEFISRGNVIELAVAVVIGAAFTMVVTAVVDDVLNPAIGALFNAESLADSLTITVPALAGGSATLKFGAVIVALIQFLIVAAFIYFAVVVPINHLKRAEADANVEAAPTPTELEVLSEIRDLLAHQTESGGGRHEQEL